MYKHASMNKVYRIVWNAALGVWQAVGEWGSGVGKATSLLRRQRRAKRWLAVLPSALMVLNVWANPTGMEVISGSVQAVQQGNILNITNSDKAVIHWQQFNIGVGETTHFIQPSASSSVLNRVVTANPSQIMGNLTSNGQVYLINPSGILVGKDAQVDVAAFVASTLNISDANFVAGVKHFSADSLPANLTNLGAIRTPNGGQVYLLGGSVDNQGNISAPNGDFIIAAGQQIQITDTATPEVSVLVPAGQVNNLGKITADAGRIGIAGAVINNTGSIKADRVVSDGGKIRLVASKTLTNSGTVSANGETIGGQIVATAEIITNSGTLTTKGKTGGGEILVGGDWQGTNADKIAHATTTMLTDTSQIDASATEHGNGGKVVVWSGLDKTNGKTSIDGSIKAESKGANTTGGKIETSGKTLKVAETIQISTNGGLWLLDPDNLTITANGSDDLAGSNISGDIVSSALNSGNTVNLTANNSIFVNDTITSTAIGSTLSLTTSTSTTEGITFSPNTSISVNSLLLTSAGGIIQQAPEANQTDHRLIVNNLNAVAKNNITLTGNNNISVFSANSSTGGNISLNSTGALTLYGVNTTGNILINVLEGNINLSIGNVSTTSTTGAMNFKGIDDEYFDYLLPFAFNYYGNVYNKAYISSNGLITFVEGTGAYNNSAHGLTSLSTSRGASSVMPIIAPAWDDWVTWKIHNNVTTNWDVYVLPTSDSLIVRWDVGHYSDNNVHAVFEAVLKSTGSIQFNYGAANSSAINTQTNTYYDVNDYLQPSPTIGLSAGDGTHFTLSSLNSDATPFNMNYLNSVSYSYNSASNNYVENILSTSGISGTTSLTSGLTGRDVSLTAHSGAITTSSGLNNISATGAVVLSATNGVGTSNSALKIQAASIGAMNTGPSGDIHIQNIKPSAEPTTHFTARNVSGSVLIDNVGSMTVGNVSALNNIGLTVHSPLIIQGNITSSNGDVALSASGTDGDITINGNISAPNGSFSVDAGNSILIARDVKISANATHYNMPTIAPTQAPTNGDQTVGEASKAITNTFANTTTTAGTTVSSNRTVNVVPSTLTSPSAAPLLPAGFSAGGTQIGEFGDADIAPVTSQQSSANSDSGSTNKGENKKQTSNDASSGSDETADKRGNKKDKPVAACAV